MLKTHNPLVSEAFARVLETMAFISLAPINGPVEGPPNPLLASIKFTGRAPGAVEIAASEEFAILLAANMLGTSPTDDDAVSRARDAIKELVNVVCGALLAQPGLKLDCRYEVGVPQLDWLDSVTDWRSYVASPGTALFDADGHTIAIRAAVAA